MIKWNGEEYRTWEEALRAQESRLAAKDRIIKSLRVYRDQREERIGELLEALIFISRCDGHTIDCCQTTARQAVEKVMNNE